MCHPAEYRAIFDECKQPSPVNKGITLADIGSKLDRMCSRLDMFIAASEARIAALEASRNNGM
jgi:hypothetical protein